MMVTPNVQYQELSNATPALLSLVRRGTDSTAWAITGRRTIKPNSPVQLAILRPVLRDQGAVFVVEANSGKEVLQIPDAQIQLDFTDGVLVSKYTYNLKHPFSAAIVSGSAKFLVVYLIDDFDDLTPYTLDLDSGDIAPLKDSGSITVFTRYQFSVAGETLLTIAPAKV
jgi:hypothetical protein